MTYPPLSQREAAERLNIAPRNYRARESGEKPDLDVGEILELAHGWDCYLQHRRDLLMPLLMDRLVSADPVTLNAILIFTQLITGPFVEPD